MISLVRKHLHYFIVGVLFVGLIGALQWEVLCSLSEKILAGYQVGGYFCWLFWWWFKALSTGQPLFHSHFLMFPDGVSLFPNSLINDVSAVLMQFFLTPYAAFNIQMILSYVFSAFAAYFLAYKLTKNSLASFCGAFIYIFNSYFLPQQYAGHLIATTIYFNPLFALCLLNYFEKPNSKNAFYTILTLFLVAMSGAYVLFSFGIIFTVCVFTYKLFFIPHTIVKWKILGPLFLGSAIVGLITIISYQPLIKYSGQWMGGSEFYSLSLKSFFDPPWFHRPNQGQELPFLFYGFRPEKMMGFIGWGTLAMIFFAIKKKLYKKAEIKIWFWIFFLSLLFSMGPWLHLTDQIDTHFPLPYLIFLKLPFFSQFRDTGRILMTTTLASCVLVAFSFNEISINWSPWRRIATAFLFLLITWQEFNVGSIGKWFISLAPLDIYQVLKKDKEPFGILELPQVYNRLGDQTLSAQYYMLFQPFHEKPMVLGFPSRYLASSLNFTENTDVVYELTHPRTLFRLGSEPSLKSRADMLRKSGKKILKENKIKYVILHPHLCVNDPPICSELKIWLDRILGSPLMEDSAGTFLYRTNS